MEREKIQKYKNIKLFLYFFHYKNSFQNTRKIHNFLKTKKNDFLGLRLF
jgi:hypothetical protein